MAYPAPSAQDPVGFLAGLKRHRELRSLKGTGAPLPGFAPHKAQLFIETVFGPDSPIDRGLLNWDTGTGKSIAALLTAIRYIGGFKRQDVAPENRPTVFIVGFTRAVLQAELMRHPELGFVSYSELATLYELRKQALEGDDKDRKRYSGYIGMLKRRITDRERGGYFQFYGYKELALRLLVPTAKGEAEGLRITELFATGTAEDGVSEIVQKIIEAEQNELLEVNQGLLERMRNGYVIADEIHDVYNTRESNMYGIALQFALDVLEEEAPRALFLSATPVSGHPTEIADLLNLLVPRSPDRPPIGRKDLFAAGDYRPGALDTISRLAAGRVSFQAVSAEDFPERDFDGAELPGVPYLRFVFTNYSSDHEAAIAPHVKEDKELPIALASLNDMIFPAPSPGEAGLAARIAAADAKWRSKIGIEVIAGQITGPFLSLPKLEKYSSKYARAVKDIIAALKAPGKILVYHNAVRGSGVHMFAEALRMNGFVEHGAPALPSTLCAACGVRRTKHEKSHKFVPAAYTTVTGDLDMSSREKRLSAFNRVDNLEGHQIRVLIGSRVIRQGLNFTAVRHMAVLSLPRDISTMIQLFGRASRRGSHKMLPPEQQQVTIRIYVHRSDRFTSPEIVKIKRDMRQYQKIQEGIRALRKYAFSTHEGERSLENPGRERVDVPELPETTSTYYGYAHADQDLQRLMQHIVALFEGQPIWGEAELKEAVAETPHPVRDSSVFTPALTELAIQKLITIPPVATRDGKRMVATHLPFRRIVRAGAYLVLVPLDAQGLPINDVEAYLRVSDLKMRKVSVNGYVHSNLSQKNFAIKLRRFEIHANKLDAIELAVALFTHTPGFNYALIKKIITDKKLSPLLCRAKSVYTSFGIMRGKSYFENYNRHTYKNGWSVAPHDAYDDRKENNIIVGYASQTAFKIRPPLQELAQQEVQDARSLMRGASCSTRPVSYLRELCSKLKIKHSSTASAKHLCGVLLSELLKRELKARQSSGKRWFYVFNETLPSIV